MVNKLKKSNSKGFTIIEVMIVLAIAALILLIVLLAVPALQRNSRNTAIKNDASAVTAGISEFNSNNDGASPTSGGSTYTTGTLDLNNAAGTKATVKLQSSDTVTLRAAGTVSSITPAAGELTITFGTKCPTSVSGASTGALTANTRSTTVVYATETSSALAAKCIDS